MAALTIIFITVIICAEIDFFAVLYCKEISEWLKAKSDEIRARTENLRNANYSSGYTDGKADGMKAFAREYDETGAEIFRREGTE